MRILFAIPHYFARGGTENYGSEQTAREARAQAVRACLASLTQTFSPAQALVDGRRRRTQPANPQLAARVTILLCTTGDAHLVGEFAGCGAEHVKTNAEPRFLGFECHKALQRGLGEYDYFAYLEDDLRLVDALFFVKLAWFTARFGDAVVLQPNRFELTADPVPYKLYIDGNPHHGIGDGVPQLPGHQRLAAPAFGQQIVFQRVANPHAGCFFLAPAQLERWAAAPDFAAPSSDFVGPLESAATLGLMRHFVVYKPARENAAFLEIEHLDRRYLGHHFRPVAGDPPTLAWC